MSKKSLKGINYKDLIENGKIIKGLTDNEKDEIEKWAYNDMDNGSYFECIEHENYYKYEKIFEEISTLRMIDSCFCYGSNFEDWKTPYVEELGEKRVNELYKMQIEKLRKTLVKENVYTDFEGVSYNSINW